MKNITEAQYDQLCYTCDKLLKQKPFSIERNANAFLHVIREHPVFLKGYKALFQKNSLSFSIHLIKLFFLNLGIGCYKLFHATYRYYFIGDRLINDQRDFDNIFISHLLNDSFITHKKDFYFFDLPQKISERDRPSLQLYINYTELSSKKICERWKYKPVVSIALPRYLSFKQEIKIRGLMFLEAILILKSKSSSALEKRIKFQAAITSLSSSTHANYRLAFLVQHYVKNNGVKYIFTTYEGHPWERLIFAMARDINPSIICIGYQHALVFKKQHAIRRKLENNFEPNYILFAGENGRRQFRAIDYLPSNRLLCFGTNRMIKSKKDKLAVQNKLRNVFLMLSEGDLIECVPLAKLIVKLALDNPEANFIIRFHPITKVENVFKKVPELAQPPMNIELSNLSFEEDLARAHFAIYRGSTTIIKAVQYGLVPLYYERQSEISIDPLYDIQKQKINLNSIEDFKLLEKIPHEELISRQHKLIDYVEGIFNPLNYDEVLKIKK